MSDNSWDRNKEITREEFEKKYENLLGKSMICLLCLESFTNLKEHSRKHIRQKIPFEIHGLEVYINKDM